MCQDGQEDNIDLNIKGTWSSEHLDVLSEILFCIDESMDEDSNRCNENNLSSNLTIINTSIIQNYMASGTGMESESGRVVGI